MDRPSSSNRPILSHSMRYLLLVSLITGSVGAVVGYAAGRTSARPALVSADSWPMVSDRRKKENFRAENPDQVLQRVSRLPVESWNYRSQPPSVRHVGPTAQDFYGAFRLGDSDTTISATDMAAVSLLAIQALERRTAKLEAQLGSVQGMAAQAPVRISPDRRQ